MKQLGCVIMGKDRNLKQNQELQEKETDDNEDIMSNSFDEELELWDSMKIELPCEEEVVESISQMRINSFLQLSKLSTFNFNKITFCNQLKDLSIDFGSLYRWNNGCYALFLLQNCPLLETLKLTLSPSTEHNAIIERLDALIEAYDNVNSNNNKESGNISLAATALGQQEQKTSDLEKQESSTLVYLSKLKIVHFIWRHASYAAKYQSELIEKSLLYLFKLISPSNLIEFKTKLVTYEYHKLLVDLIQQTQKDTLKNLLLSSCMDYSFLFNLFCRAPMGLTRSDVVIPSCIESLELESTIEMDYDDPGINPFDVIREIMLSDKCCNLKSLS